MVPYDPDFVELITSLEEALTMLQRMQLLPSSGDFGDPFDVRNLSPPVCLSVT